MYKRQGQKILLFYILGMTLLTFNVCGADKFAAQRQRRRVPEKVLFLLSALGGSVGMYLGMFTFRHKTKHWYFVVGIPPVSYTHLVAQSVAPTFKCMGEA